MASCLQCKKTFALPGNSGCCSWDCYTKDLRGRMASFTSIFSINMWKEEETNPNPNELPPLEPLTTKNFSFENSHETTAMQPETSRKSKQTKSKTKRVTKNEASTTPTPSTTSTTSTISTTPATISQLKKRKREQSKDQNPTKIKKASSTTSTAPTTRSQKKRKREQSKDQNPTKPKKASRKTSTASTTPTTPAPSTTSTTPTCKRRRDSLPKDALCGLSGCGVLLSTLPDRYTTLYINSRMLCHSLSIRLTTRRYTLYCSDRCYRIGNRKPDKKIKKSFLLDSEGIEDAKQYIRQCLAEGNSCS